ncbi:element excision factor XisI family protein [Arthrospira sp. PCC 9108]|nr:element excision factor XisI family protein [Arthrospira sp. PCC 9108]
MIEYAQSKPAYGEIEVETIFDTQRNHYQIVHFGCTISAGFIRVSSI